MIIYNHDKDTCHLPIIGCSLMLQPNFLVKLCPMICISLITVPSNSNFMIINWGTISMWNILPFLHIHKSQRAVFHPKQFKGISSNPLHDNSHDHTSFLITWFIKSLKHVIWLLNWSCDWSTYLVISIDMWWMGGPNQFGENLCPFTKWVHLNVSKTTFLW